MALIGISVGGTFEYVLDRCPCKKRVEHEVPPGSRTLHPTTPPPITATRTCDLMRRPSPCATCAHPGA